MTEYNDDISIEQDTDSDLVKQLRKQLREKSKLVDERDAELKTFRDEKRSSSLSDLLTAAGVNPKLSRFLPADFEPTKENVEAWIEENADALNIVRQPVTDAPEGQAATGVDAETVAAFRAAQSAEAGAGVVPGLGADKVRQTLKEVRGSGSESAIKKLQAAGLVGG